MKRGLVLVVDDNEAIRESIGQVLEDLGCEVLTAKNGKDALAWLGRRRPRLILVDLMMPVMNGWQFLEARSRDASLASIPVAVMTAARDAGVDASAVVEVLTKPVFYDQLAGLLERTCSEHHAEAVADGRGGLCGVPEQEAAVDERLDEGAPAQLVAHRAEHSETFSKNARSTRRAKT